MVFAGEQAEVFRCDGGDITGAISKGAMAAACAAMAGGFAGSALPREAEPQSAWTPRIISQERWNAERETSRSGV